MFQEIKRRRAGVEFGGETKTRIGLSSDHDRELNFISTPEFTYAEKLQWLWLLKI
jgi:hypothetical protein